jgi:hypothetical protein
VDPFSLLLLAQTAVSAIKQGCDFLRAGRIQLESAKKTINGAIADVKAVRGFVDWVIGLFVTKPSHEVAKPLAKAVVKSKPTAAQQQSYEQLELELIKSVGENIGVLFDTQQQINTFSEELEEESKRNYDPTQNNSRKAIERALIELQLEKLMEQTREAMVYAPLELKDLYSRFLKMHGQIEREQTWAKAEMMRRARLARWRQEQKEIRRIELMSASIAVVFISLFFGWFMWALQNLSGGF